jgi:hypothetical protein
VPLIQAEKLTKIYGKGDIAVIAHDHVNLNVDAATVEPRLKAIAALIPARQAAGMEIVRALWYE